MSKIVPNQTPRDYAFGAFDKKFKELKPLVPTFLDSFELYMFESFFADNLVTKISPEFEEKIAAKSLQELDRTWNQMSKDITRVDGNEGGMMNKVLREVQAVSSPEQQVEAEEVMKNFQEYFFDEMEAVKQALEIKKTQQEAQDREYNKLGFLQKILQTLGFTQSAKIDVTDNTQEEGVIMYSNNSPKPIFFSPKPVVFSVDKKNKIVMTEGKRVGFSPSPNISSIAENESSIKEPDATAPASGSKSPDLEAPISAMQLQSPRERTLTV